MNFTKYHALGNDYIVIEPNQILTELSVKQIQMICHRNFGIGSDGILFGPFPSSSCNYAVKIFNPDGSEAEKSGNGLRIFARYLYEKKYVQTEQFTIETKGGTTQSVIYDSGKTVSVDMGTLVFTSDRIPMTGPKRLVFNETMTIQGVALTYCAANIGNPHCVILCDEISKEKAIHFGPSIENESRFPNKTNVQLMKVIDRQNIQIEIWERGAGYTLASGSSSCAAAGVACRLGLCDPNLTVHMPGGQLKIKIDSQDRVNLTGEVTRIGHGVMDIELFDFNA
ncbi:MAG: diaminopimelate epimerase [Desulfobacterales bacterium]|nr:diaminopimelate epimerase [Desulfobacterales bacterium]